MDNDDLNINLREFNVVNQAVLNAFTSRAQYLKNLMDPRRDIDEECGYPDLIDVDQYKVMYLRNGIAQRVVDIWPDECWVQNPQICQTEEQDRTEFETVWEDLEEAYSLYSYLYRVDKLSGIAGYAVVLLGVNDGRPLEEPVDGLNLETNEFNPNLQHGINFIRVFDQQLAPISSFVTDTTNSRYGDPEYYNITFETLHSTSGDPYQSGSNTTTQKVHWSRVIHIADNRLSSEVYGSSRQEPCWNYLYDLQKILGASGEGYWRGAFPGISLETQPGFEDIDKASVREEMEKYMNSLQRYIANVGVTAKTLTPNIQSPKDAFHTALQAISITTRIPMRILMGSEQGKLAADQDVGSLSKRIMTRQHHYLSPYVIRPFINRLIDLGTLPMVDKNEMTGRYLYYIKWSDINSPSDEQKSLNAAKWVEAVAKYIQSGADQLILPFRFLTHYMDFTPAEAEEIVAEAEGKIREEEEESKLLKEAIQLEESTTEVEALQEEEDNELEEDPMEQEEKVN